MFSTTTVPSSDFILSAHGRPTASLTPPGVNGITSRIGRSGYRDCARALRGNKARAPTAAIPSASRSRRFIGSFSAVVGRRRPSSNESSGVALHPDRPFSLELQLDRLDHRSPFGDLVFELAPRLGRAGINIRVEARRDV